MPKTVSTIRATRGARARRLGASLAALVAALALYAHHVEAPNGLALTDYVAQATTVPVPDRAPAA